MQPSACWIRALLYPRAAAWRASPWLCHPTLVRAPSTRSRSGKVGQDGQPTRELRPVRIPHINRGPVINEALGPQRSVGNFVAAWASGVWFVLAAGPELSESAAERVKRPSAKTSMSQVFGAAETTLATGLASIANQTALTRVNTQLTARGREGFLDPSVGSSSGGSTAPPPASTPCRFRRRRPAPARYR